MIISMAGLKGVGKSTLVSKLRAAHSDWVFFSSTERQAVLGQLRPIDPLTSDSKEAFLQIQSQLIEGTQAFVQSHPDQIILMDRGIEDTEHYSFHFPETFGFDWKADVEARFKAFRVASIQSDVILFLDVTQAALAERLSASSRAIDTTLRCGFMSAEKWKHFYEERPQTIVIDTTNLRPNEVFYRAEALIHALLSEDPAPAKKSAAVPFVKFVVEPLPYSVRNLRHIIQKNGIESVLSGGAALSWHFDRTRAVTDLDLCCLKQDQTRLRELLNGLMLSSRVSDKSDVYYYSFKETEPIKVHIAYADVLPPALPEAVGLVLSGEATLVEYLQKIHVRLGYREIQISQKLAQDLLRLRQGNYNVTALRNAFKSVGDIPRFLEEVDTVLKIGNAPISFSFILSLLAS